MECSRCNDKNITLHRYPNSTSSIETSICTPCRAILRREHARKETDPPKQTEIKYTACITLPLAPGVRHGTLDVKIERKIPTTAPYLDYELNPMEMLTAISVSGHVRFRDGGENAGQCQDMIRDMYPDNKNLIALLDISDAWHLNDLTAGTKAQTDAIDQYRIDNPEWRYDYSAACEILKCAGLNPDIKTPCATQTPIADHRAPEYIEKYRSKGYTYGSAWLTKQCPKSVVTEIRELCAALGSPMHETTR